MKIIRMILQSRHDQVFLLQKDLGLTVAVHLVLNNVMHACI